MKEFGVENPFDALCWQKFRPIVKILCLLLRLLYSTLSLLFQYLLPGVAIAIANSRIYRCVILLP
jgi:hypothetical protein